MGTHAQLGDFGLSTAKMTDPTRYRLFARHFLVLLDASKAAVEAGYSPTTANQAGHKLLKHPVVQRELEKLRARQSADSTGSSTTSWTSWRISLLPECRITPSGSPLTTPWSIYGRWIPKTPPPSGGWASPGAGTGKAR